jgi:hypothetical protein
MSSSLILKYTGRVAVWAKSERGADVDRDASTPFNLKYHNLASEHV